MYKVEEIEVLADVVYGSGGIDFTPATGARRRRELRLDIYRPRATGDERRPALILAFGGAFQRGTRQDDRFGDGGLPNSSVADYARDFARRGYVCFSIDYRLMPEAPDPGSTPTLLPDEEFLLERINHVRSLLGLPSANETMVREAIEAATDDMTMAVDFVRTQAASFRIDPERIALGGFSAGGLIALNTAFAARVGVAAVVSLSGCLSRRSFDAHIAGATHEPRALLFVGEHDLPEIRQDIAYLARRIDQARLPHRIVEIAGATHFYAKETPIPSANGSQISVIEEMAAFLAQVFRAGTKKSAGEGKLERVKGIEPSS